MISLIVPVLAVLVGLLLTGCRSQQPHLTVQVVPSREISLDGWEHFASPDGAFRILFPDKPKEVFSRIAKLKLSKMTVPGPFGSATELLFCPSPLSPFIPLELTLRDVASAFRVTLPLE